MNLPDRFVIECTLELGEKREPVLIKREFRKYRTGYRDIDNEFYHAKEITEHIETGHWRLQ